MMRSIQSRLTWALTSTAILLSGGLGVLLYHMIGAEMTRNFDRGLKSKGEALVSLVSLEPRDAPGSKPATESAIPTTRMSVAGGMLDFEFNEATMPEYRPGKKAEYFEIRFADGKPYVKSKSLGEADLSLIVAGPGKETIQDLKFPDGRKGRAIRIAFVPQSEQPPPEPAAPMVAVITRDREELDESLAHLFQILAAATLVLGAATGLTSVWIVRRLLLPLRRVAEQAAAINATTLDARFRQREMPAELAPICDRLNDLLGRLEAAFTRERRFTSDVAHELRTPIAELRSIAEVALAWPQDGQAVHGALSESLAIAVQMQTLVTTLLALARTDQSRLQVELQPVELVPMVDHIIEQLRSTLNARVEVSIPPSATVIAEPALLKSVLTNLLSNAIEYASGDEPVRCEAILTNGQVSLMVENQVENFAASDLPRMFEPFWRKNAARSDNAHAGLGLSLVRAYCGLMGVEVVATMPREGILRVGITFHARVSAGTDDAATWNQPVAAETNSGV